MIESVLNKKVYGESYLEGDWKNIVLRHFNKIYANEMTVSELVQLLPRYGVQFKQNQKLIKYPIQELLEFIGRLSKKEIYFKD